MYAFCISILICVSYLAVVNAQHFQRFCVYNGWALSRDGQHGLQPEDIDPFLCTHIIFSFAEIDETGIRLKDPDHFQDNYIYQRIIRLRRLNHRLNMILSVGGWDKGGEGFSKLVSSRENMLKFTKWVITYLRRHDFDGLDFDWQFPTFRESNLQDKKKFADLCDVIALEFDIEEIPDIKWKLTFTLTMHPLAPVIQRGYDIKRLASKAHYINLKTYDLYGHFDDPLLARHHAALEGHAGFHNMRNIVKRWEGMGVLNHKIIAGIPFFGRSYRLAHSNMTQPGAPAIGPGSDNGDGIPIKHLCHLIRSGLNESYIPSQKVPYIVAGDEWIGFDNQRSVMEKASFVFDAPLAGVYLNSLDMDDHSGACGSRFPLTMAVIHGLRAYMLYMQRKHMSIGEIYRVKIHRAQVSRRAYFMAGKMKSVEKMEAKIKTLRKEQEAAMSRITIEHQQAQAMMNRGFSLPPLKKPSWSWN